MSCLNIMLGYYFSVEVFLQGMARNNPTKKHENSQKSVKFIVTNCKDRFKLSITTTCI